MLEKISFLGRDKYNLECGDLSPLWKSVTCHGHLQYCLDKSRHEKAATSRRTPNYIKKKLHICIDVRMVKSGGIGTFIQELLKALYEEVSLTLLYLAKDKEYLKQFPKANFIEMKSSIYTIKEQLELKQKIPLCDLFFSPHFNIPLLPIRAKRRIVSVHDLFHLSHPLPLLQKIYAKIVYNGAFLLSDVVTTVSHFSKNEMVRLATFKPKKNHVIYPSLPQRYFEQHNSSSHISTSYILAVSSPKRHKNLTALVEAYAALECTESLVIVCLKQSLDLQKEWLTQFPHLQSKLIVTGCIDDETLLALYSSAKLFVFPSLYEGFGFPPLEAMARGCPVVASRCGSIPEVCKEGAYYVDIFSKQSLMLGMRRCLNEHALRAQLIAKGRQVAALYPFSSFKSSYLRVINESCNCA